MRPTPPRPRIPVRKLAIRVRRSGGSMVVGVRGDAFVLPESAELIFTAIDGKLSEADIAERLANTFDLTAEEARADTEDFVSWLHGQGLVDFVHGPEAAVEDPRGHDDQA